MKSDRSRCLSILPDFHKIPWKHFVCLESQEWLHQECKYSGHRNFWCATGAIQVCTPDFLLWKSHGQGWGGSMITMALGHSTTIQRWVQIWSKSGLRCQQRGWKKLWGEGSAPGRAVQNPGAPSASWATSSASWAFNNRATPRGTQEGSWWISVLFLTKPNWTQGVFNGPLPICNWYPWEKYLTSFSNDLQ